MLSFTLEERGVGIFQPQSPLEKIYEQEVEPIIYLCLNNKILSSLKIPISTETAVKSLNCLLFPPPKVGLRVSFSLTPYMPNISGFAHVGSFIKDAPLFV